MTKKIAVLLAGAGYLDGSEITEAVSCLLALSELEIEVSCFAPDIDFASTSHLRNENGATGETRNVLRESARIARGSVQNILELRETDFDALIIPGGFGAALHLCTWAKDGVNAKMNRETARAVVAFHKASKPIGAACIAPTIIAKVLGKLGVNLTIGNDEATIAEIEKTGAQHVKCAVTDYVSDRDHKIITTPAYMYGNAAPFEVYTGIRKMIREVCEMA